MVRVLLAWELGGGLGHLLPLVSVVEALLREDCEVYLAVRDVTGVRPIFPDPRVKLAQAPIAGPAQHPIDPVRSFSQVLHNCGFDDPRLLLGRAGVWRTLVDLIRPDVVVCEHAPTLLVAMRGQGIPCAAMGTGFACPPPVYPLPDLRSWMPEPEKVEEDEARTLGVVNEVLREFEAPPLDFLGQLYGDCEETFLRTLPELDHYPDRPKTRYYGIWQTPGGQPPVWPSGSGRRVFAYLKPFPALGQLLRTITAAECRALVYIEGFPDPARQEFETPSLCFVDRPLDLEKVASSCDMALLNGGHNAGAQFLLAGKPVMTVPLTLEQGYNGSFVGDLGAGFGALPETPEVFDEVLADVLTSETYAAGARKFAARYADFPMQQQPAEISNRILELARGG